MDKLPLVHVDDGPGQGLGHLRGHRSGLRLTVNLLLQRAAVHIFHGNMNSAGVLAYFVDPDNAGMLQAGDSLELGAQPGCPRGRGVLAGRDNLERHNALPAGFAGLVDNAGGRSADFRENIVAGKRGHRPGEHFTAQTRKAHGDASRTIEARRHRLAGRVRRRRVVPRPGWELLKLNILGGKPRARGIPILLGSTQVLKCSDWRRERKLRSGGIRFL